MTAVQRELESNLRATQQVSTYHSGVVERLRAPGAANVTTVPRDAHPRGLRQEPDVVSAAWDSAQSGGVVNDVPVATVLAIARAYEAQRVHLQQNSRLLETLYAGLLQPGSSLPPRPAHSPAS